MVLHANNRYKHQITVAVPNNRYGSPEVITKIKLRSLTVEEQIEDNKVNTIDNNLPLWIEVENSALEEAEAEE